MKQLTKEEQLRLIISRLTPLREQFGTNETFLGQKTLFLFHLQRRLGNLASTFRRFANPKKMPEIAC